MSQSSKYIKSKSVTLFKTLPLENIQFNPSEFQVGESKIQRLPERIITRRSSQPNLPRTEKYTQNKQCKQLEVSLLMKINENLSKQNKELKKDLELYKRIVRNNSTSSKNNSRSKEYAEESSTKNLRQIVVDKINRTKCSSRLASDNETGLYSSKQMSYGDFETIKDMYENLKKKSIKPSLEQFQEQLDKFFVEIRQNCMKLTYLFQSIVKSETQVRSANFSKCQSLLDSVAEICQLKVQPQKTPKQPFLIQKPKSRVKVERQFVKQRSQERLNKEKQDILQLLSPQQVMDKFQKFVLKIIKSPKMLKMLKSNLVFGKLMKKLSEL